MIWLKISKLDKTIFTTQQQFESCVKERKYKLLNLENMATFTPVSYTHLDVYKRQILLSV